MSKLNQTKKIYRQDKRWQVLKSIESVGKQCNQVWQEMRWLKIPDNYQKINQIVIAGMGGSGIGGKIIQTLYNGQLKIPLQVAQGYQLPKSVNNQTLFVAMSYSGNTEEIIQLTKQAIKRKAKIFIITTGGILAGIAQKNNLPYYQFKPRFNPAGAPRYGLGYLLMSELVLLAKIKAIKFTNADWRTIIRTIKKANQSWRLENKIKNNEAKILAKILANKTIVTIGGEFLQGATVNLVNQISETAKQFSVNLVLPEFNHNLIESFGLPKENRHWSKFLLINSLLYCSANQKRLELTEQILRKYKIKSVVYQPQAETKLGQVFELIMLGYYFSFYLAILNKVNPRKEDYIEWLKEQLVD